MNINKLNGCQLFQLLCHPVFLTLHFKDLSIYGNVYSIDPESRSVVLVQFDNKKLLNFVIVPGDSIATITVINNLKTKEAEGCIANISDVFEARQILNKIFNPNNNETSEPEKLFSKEEIHKKYNNIISILKQRQVLFREEIDITDEKKHKIIIVGAVRIVYPYLENNIISTNQIALKKIIKLLKTLLY